ncbi:cyclic lactone autoinducer peptide [Clostridium estertheticum]|nr:cyclic lactone autoinducer peptide [Clostridium estertheticum]MBX4260268.1 cyclic lactone autoinducer peptide [Clostridium estertheticum]WLC71030.1 cyclic lactone autoinducer peptide [Clostridium estertheticum]
MKFLKKHLFSLIALATTLAATSVATSACYFGVYQPEEPKCLREK